MQELLASLCAGSFSDASVVEKVLESKRRLVALRAAIQARQEEERRLAEERRREEERLEAQRRQLQAQLEEEARRKANQPAERRSSPLHQRL